MAQFDIIARLQLRADQFASEGGRAAAEVTGKMTKAAADIRKPFAAAFADIQQLAQKSIELPRTERGSLNLSGEIASLNASAAAAENRADAFREMQQAALRAAAGESAHSEALRRDADAAMVAVRAEEEAAAVDRRRIAQLEVLQAELDQTASVTMRMGDAQENAAKKSGALRQAMQGASYQVQDLFTQISMGTNPLQAFVVQGGQLAGQFSSVEGKAGKLAGFFLGPWGLALTGAALVVAHLTDGIFDETEAHKKAREAAEKHRDAVLDLARAQEKAIITGERKQAIDVAEIQNELRLAMATRTRLAASLASAKADLERSKSLSSGAEGGVDVGTTVGATLDRQIAALTEAIKGNDASIAEFQKGVDIGFSRLVGMKVDARSTPEGRIRANYDRDRANILSDPAYQGTANANKLTVALRALNAERDRELKKIEKRTTTRDPDTATPSSVAALLRRELKGVQITSTTGGKHTPGSDHYKSAAIDFVPAGGMSSMSKADVRALFERAGIPIRRNAGGVEQLFGPGDKGHSDHFHVAWEKGKVALDNYRASEKDAAAAARELKREQQELEQALGEILKALDPLAAATARYTDRLADLAKLQAAGKITLDQQLDYGRDAQREFGTAKSTIAGDRLRDIFGADQVDAISREWEDNVARATQDWGKGLEEGAERATDVLRDGAGEIAAMLGLRVRGPLGALLSGRGRVDDQQAAKISEAVNSLGLKLPREMGKVVQGASTAVVIGQLGSAAGKIAGLKQSGTGSAIGGLIGGLTPLGPVGAALGGLLGGTIGGLFKKTKQASSTIGFGSDGLSAGASTGTGTAEKAAASASANSVVGSLNRIAEALGGSVTGAGSVSIGYRPGHKDGAYRVDTSGQGRLTGVLAFATEEEAIRAAINDALQDGVIGGISDASKRILAAGGDLEKAITKAAMIEAVPKDLKAMLDPLGAAVDELNTKFQRTVEALKEGGATAEQMAQAQRLYDLQLEQVKSSTASASAGLKDFLKSLNIGSGSPLSARDREAAALADLKPYLTQIDAGQSIDQGKYQEAAKAYLDIERELYGSTSKFFEAFDAVQASTAKAIATIDNAVPVSAGVASPFAKETAASAAATASGVQTVAEIAADQTDLLVRIAQAVEALGGDLGGSSGFIGSSRLFAAIG